MGFFGIMRVDKVKTSRDCGKVMDEMLRKSRGLSTEEYLQTHFKGSYIDVERSALNVDKCIKSFRTEPPYDAIKGICDKAGAKIRSNSVLGVTAIYTASPEYMSQLSYDEQGRFFEECLAFHKAHYGKVVAWSVHYDESTPHLHVFSVPLTKEGHLSAKELLGNRKQYHQRQEDFYKQVCEPRGLQHPQTKDREHNRKHIDTLVLKVQEREKDLLRLKAQERELTRSVQSLTLSLDMAKTEIDRIEQEQDMTIDDLIRQHSDDSRQGADARKYKRLKAIFAEQGLDVDDLLREQEQGRDFEH